MSLQCGIVGLPNVGKSTLFNALTQSGIAAENYPFCTIEPNIGIVAVPDERLTELARIAKPQRVLPATVEFVDIAGLVEGASKGEGLGNQFLANIRETDAIIHVVRCFHENNVIHVRGRADPVDDIEIIATELALADMASVEKIITRVAKQARAGGSKEAQRNLEVLSKAQQCLNSGQAVRTLDLSKEEWEALRPFCLLTAKPVLYVANLSEDERSHSLLQEVEQYAQHEKAPVISICAKLESEIAELEVDERQLFLQDMGLQEPGLHRLIRAAYQLLGLQTFFTAGAKEVRAWTMHSGDTAPQAAGVIHSDFERGFILSLIHI